MALGDKDAELPRDAIDPRDALRPRKFERALVPALQEGVKELFVTETIDFLERRFQKLAIDFDHIVKTNFNPFLLLITAPVYNIFSPFEVAERLQLAKAFHGDDTAFGRMAEERYLTLLGASKPPEKIQRREAWEPIDLDLSVDGQRYLLSIKSGPWTMNQAHANAMVDKLPAIREETGAEHHPRHNLRSL